MVKRRLPVLALLLLCCWVSVQANSNSGIRMDASRTRVGLARVTLQVADLMLDGNLLLGTYELKIPLAPMLNDRGTIQLPGVESLERLIRLGGRVTGSGSSSEDGRTHRVIANFQPGGRVDIMIDTGSRRLAFETRVREAGAARNSR